MNILDSILSSVGLSRKSAAIPSALGGYGSADPFALFKTSNKIDAGKAMDVYNNWVYACIRAIAEEIGNAKFKLYKVGKDGKTEEIQEHDLLDLLEGVNDYQTGFELRYLAAAHLEMVGNAYWYLSGVKDTKGVPTAIYPLNPRYLKIKRGTIENPIEFFTYAPSNQKPQVLQPYEVLHLKYPDPNDTVEGIGTVQSIAQWIDADSLGL